MRIAPPPASPAPLSEPGESAGQGWTPAAVGQLIDRLGRQRSALAAIASDRLEDAWHHAVRSLRRPGSAARETLMSQLVRSCRLSAPGLEAGLDTVLRSLEGPSVHALFARWLPVARIANAPPSEHATLIVLASNLPGLAAQPLLRALAAREPALLKSASAEPFFAPALIHELARAEPLLGEAYAAITWRGGDQALEAEAAHRAHRIVVFGQAAAVDAYRHLAAGKVEDHGPRASVAIVAADADLGSAAGALARDIALFDQRGCLSVQAIYTAAAPAELAARVAAALVERAAAWPPGPIDSDMASAVQQLRAEAELRGLHVENLPLRAGTVVIEPDPRFVPSPGLRTVRIHPLPELDRLPAILAPWSGLLQGIAVAGSLPQGLRSELARLGVTRVATAGEIHDTDAEWA